MRAQIRQFESRRGEAKNHSNSNYIDNLLLFANCGHKKKKYTQMTIKLTRKLINCLRAQVTEIWNNNGCWLLLVVVVVQVVSETISFDFM